MSLDLACQILAERTSVKPQPGASDSSCVLAFDRGLNLEMSEIPERACLRLRTEIGPVPTEATDRETFLRKSLRLNLKRLRTQAASVALDETKSVLFLWQWIAVPIPSQVEIFCDEVETFLNHADFWRSRTFLAPNSADLQPELS